jgi:deoxyribonuclease I
MLTWGLLILQLGFFSAWGAPQKLMPYYSSLAQTKDIKATLFTILDSYHLPKEDGDLILPACSQGTCYKQQSLSYKGAREKLFGYIHLKGNAQDGYSLETYYCGNMLTADDFGSKKNDSLGPNIIPNNNIVNVEHAWPQSHFTSKFPKNMQKTDLHILFPEISKVNSIRGNFPYGEVVTPKNVPCADAAMGMSKENERVFEPSHLVKGDMARATFYYVTRYKVALDSHQEAYLRAWHKADPVDEHEIERNEKVFELQKVRNPFVDMPELVDQIPNF